MRFENTLDAQAPHTAAFDRLYLQSFLAVTLQQSNPESFDPKSIAQEV